MQRRSKPATTDISIPLPACSSSLPRTSSRSGPAAIPVAGTVPTARRRAEWHMLDHLSIQCADLTTSAAFYDAVLAPLGGRRLMDFGEVIGYGLEPKPDFWLGPRSTGDVFRESHIAFEVPTSPAVRPTFAP